MNKKLLLTMLLMFTICAFAQAAPALGVTNDVATTAIVKAIGVAGAVSGLIQIIKIKAPYLTGNAAITINVLGALTGAWALSTPGQWKTPSFWVQVAASVIGAAGVHDLASFTKIFKQSK
jgi:hypothetical protein